MEAGKPITLDPQWWNTELVTNRGYEIVGILERFYGKPLQLQQYDDNLREPLFAALAGIGVPVTEVIYNPKEALGVLAMENAMEKRFDDVLREVRMRRLDQVAGYIDPLHDAFGKFWKDLNESWKPWDEGMPGGIQFYARNILWTTLFDTILFTVSECTNPIISYKIFLYLLEKGNFPLGHLREDKFLVQVAPVAT